MHENLCGSETLPKRLSIVMEPGPLFSAGAGSDSGSGSTYRKSSKITVNYCILINFFNELQYLTYFNDLTLVYLNFPHKKNLNSGSKFLNYILKNQTWSQGRLKGGGSATLVVSRNSFYIEQNGDLQLCIFLCVGKVPVLEFIVWD